jgi:hypothetical protein
MNNGPGTFWMYRKHPVGLPGSTTFSLLLRFGSRAEAIDTSMVAVRTILFGFYRNLIEIA